MTSSLCALVAAILTLAVPLLLLVALIDILTMSEPRRIRLYRRAGYSQRAIAERLNITRYRVRQALAVA